MKLFAAPLLLAAAAACAGVPQPQALSGDWGGRHVALQLGPAGGTLDYDCASGTIGPLGIGANGSFTAEGTHTPATGGPERVGEVRPTFAARYSGTISASRMTLRGRLENGVELGPFELRKGAEPIIFRCL